MTSPNESARMFIVHLIQEAQVPIAAKEKLLARQLSAAARNGIESALAKDRIHLAKLEARLGRPALANLRPCPGCFDLT